MKRGRDAFAPRPQSADKACKRKNCPDQREIRGNFCFLRQLHMQPAVTYVHVSSLVCKFASLSCRLSHPSGSLLTLSTSWGDGNSAVSRFLCLPEHRRVHIVLLRQVGHIADGDAVFRGFDHSPRALLPKRAAQFDAAPVSYTHLDVYKRQAQERAYGLRRAFRPSE